MDQKIEDFKGLDIKLEYDLKPIAEECLSDIKTNCDPKWKKYKKGWKLKEKHSGNDTYYVIYNDKHYRLTHLLEKGHLIINKLNGVGWAKPHPHIAPAFNKSKSNIVKKVEKTIKIK